MGFLFEYFSNITEMKYSFKVKKLKTFKLGKRGSPLVEEGLIIGLSIIIIVIFAGAVLNLVGWAETSIGDLVYQFQTLFQNLFFTG